jgi:excisionase family DNA binding protein
MKSPIEDLLTIDEAAALLRMSKKSFRRRMDQGEFDVLRDRRVILIPRRAVAEYVRRHTFPRSVDTERQRLGGTRGSPPPIFPSQPSATPRRVRKLWDSPEDDR